MKIGGAHVLRQVIALVLRPRPPSASPHPNSDTDRLYQHKRVDRNVAEVWVLVCLLVSDEDAEYTTKGRFFSRESSRQCGDVACGVWLAVAPLLSPLPGLG